MDEYGCENAIGVIDGSAHAKQGDKTPGVQRQWCGESGKIDNCVVGQHLIYTNNDPKNPFSGLHCLGRVSAGKLDQRSRATQGSPYPGRRRVPHEVADRGRPGRGVPCRRRSLLLDHLR